jgi:hypothetical protein
MSRETTSQDRWLPAVILVALGYVLVGYCTTLFADSAATDLMRNMWRRAAFLVSGFVFVLHFWYDFYRRHHPPRATALHASLSVALAAFILAVQANVHAWVTGTGNTTMLAIALLVWPTMTGIPAYLVGRAVGALLARRRRP